MQSPRNLPNFERLSVLIATILLAYAIARFVNLPGRDIPLQFVGIYLALQINAKTIIVVAITGITATGTDWLLRGHNKLGKKSTLPHWILPGLTAWVITVPLNNLPVSPFWWAIFLGGGILLLLVLIAEYIAVDYDDVLYPAASVSLIVLSYALFLILAISTRTIGLRLLLTLPPLSLAAGLISLRTTFLRLNRWQYPQALTAALLTGQFVAAFHYLPLRPIPYGLALLASVYAYTNFVVNLDQSQTPRQAMVEPLIALVAFLAMAVWLQ